MRNRQKKERDERERGSTVVDRCCHWEWECVANDRELWRKTDLSLPKLLQAVCSKPITFSSTNNNKRVNNQRRKRRNKIKGSHFIIWKMFKVTVMNSEIWTEIATVFNLRFDFDSIECISGEKNVKQLFCFWTLHISHFYLLPEISMKLMREQRHSQLRVSETQQELAPLYNNKQQTIREWFQFTLIFTLTFSMKEGTLKKWEENERKRKIKKNNRERTNQN